MLLYLAELGMRTAGAIYLSRYYDALDGEERRAGGIKVLCLGESTTAGLWVDFKYSYPKQLERRLREHYGRDDIYAVVPPHIGQNTSQMANRIENYLKRYQPRLVVVMAGVNDNWAFAESHAIDYLPLNSTDARKLYLASLLDQLRLGRLLKTLYMKVAYDEKDNRFKRNPYYLWGHVDYYLYSPHLPELPRRYHAAFRKAWAENLRKIIRVSRQRGSEVIFMTYHSGAHFLGLHEQLEPAQSEKVFVVRNDLLFRPYYKDGSIRELVLHDNWHPNEKGYSIIAQELTRVLTEQDFLGLREGRSRFAMEVGPLALPMP